MPLLKKSSAAVVDAPKQDIPTLAQEAQVAAAKTAVKKAASSETMTRKDWDQKDRRISRQGLFQAALQSVGILQLNTGNDLKSYLDLVRQVADEGLEYVNRA
jgi:hypothetical protein